MKDPKIAAVFKDPEDPSKGRMTSCISGWTCYTVNLVKQIEYGLDKYYTNFDPGSGGALDAAIAGAFAKKKPGYVPVVPGNTEVVIYIPISRQNTVIAAKATADQVSQLADGKVDAAGFMRLIKDSIQTL